MKGSAAQSEAGHFAVGHLNAFGVRGSVFGGTYTQACHGVGRRDAFDDGLQRPPSPALGDGGEKPMFTLIPLAGARRVVTHADTKSGLVGEALQGEFPQPSANRVAASAVGGYEQLARLRVGDFTPYGSALPSARSTKSSTRTAGGCPLGCHSRPGFL